METHQISPFSLSKPILFKGQYDSIQWRDDNCYLKQSDTGLQTPVASGLRLAVFYNGQWLPAVVQILTSVAAKADTTHEMLKLALTVFAAGEEHAGQTVEVVVEQVDGGCLNISPDYLSAEQVQIEKTVELVKADGIARYYTGNLFLQHVNGQVIHLERDTRVEIELLPDQKSVWLVKDLLPDSKQIVLREPSEKNGFNITKTEKISIESKSLLTCVIVEKPRFRFGHDTPAQRHSGYRQVPKTWLKQLASNSKGIASVLDMILFRPIEGGLVPNDHPWVTGISPHTGRHIWSDNVLFASPRKAVWQGEPKHHPDADVVIISKVGTFLAAMVKKSASTLEHPFGTKSRMPAAINYIHGAVHFNAGIMLFNDFDEAIYYLSDKRFVVEMQRFAEETKREIILVFREKVYEPKKYAYLAGMIRSVLPWFSNTNGPMKAPAPEDELDPFLVEGRVLWGNPAPYPVVNPITGNWKRDVYLLAASANDPSLLVQLCRKPIEPAQYFREQYQGVRQNAQRLERALALATGKRVKLRGDNLFFVSSAGLAKEKDLARLKTKPYVKDGLVEKRFDVIVIGAGPAGLSIAQQLQAYGVQALVLEKAVAAGDSWRKMPTNLSLLTRWSLNELPDTPAVIKPPKELVDAKTYARYLEHYANHHQISVRYNSEVVKLSKEDPETFTLTLATGEKLYSKIVINATGYFGNQFIPDISGSRVSQIRQLHFGKYENPKQIDSLLRDREQRRVLIVGKGLSAGQAMLEMEKAGFKVSLSLKNTIEFGASPRTGLLFQRFLPVIEWGFGKNLLSYRSEASKVKMQGGKTQKLIESGAVALEPAIEKFEQGYLIRFVDGTTKEYDLVLYCTGFRPQLKHLSYLNLDEKTGLPSLVGMESLELPELYFLGLDGLTSYRSRFLRGIRDDASKLAYDIAMELS